MTAIVQSAATEASSLAMPRDRFWRRGVRSGRTLVGGGILVVMVLACLLTLPATASKSSALYFDAQNLLAVRQHPSLSGGPARWFGTDILGRSLLGRCLFGGTISLAIGAAAACVSLVLGVGVGLVAGYRGGWIDALLMRSVDVLFGLPDILMVILLQLALKDHLTILVGSPGVANVVVLFLAIGLVSWLTMARVVRGQVLALRGLPFVEAARATGLTEWRIFFRHIFPNLAGPIIVYATLTVPKAILEESLLSFLGVGVTPPLPSWGELAAEGLQPALNPIHSGWWLLLFPCTLLAVTLLALNFVGDGLRDVFDPKREKTKI